VGGTCSTRAARARIEAMQDRRSHLILPARRSGSACKHSCTESHADSRLMNERDADFAPLPDAIIGPALAVGEHVGHHGSLDIMVLSRV
jgi:hypothetical protein